MTSKGFCVKTLSKCDDSAGQECPGVSPRGDEMDTVNVVAQNARYVARAVNFLESIQGGGFLDRGASVPKAGTLGLGEGAE